VPPSSPSTGPSGAPGRTGRPPAGGCPSGRWTGPSPRRPTACWPRCCPCPPTPGPSPSWAWRRCSTAWRDTVTTAATATATGWRSSAGPAPSPGGCGSRATTSRSTRPSPRAASGSRRRSWAPTRPSWPTGPTPPCPSPPPWRPRSGSGSNCCTPCRRKSARPLSSTAPHRPTSSPATGRRSTPARCQEACPWPGSARPPPAPPAPCSASTSTGSRPAPPAPIPRVPPSPGREPWSPGPATTTAWPGRGWWSSWTTPRTAPTTCTPWCATPRRLRGRPPGRPLRPGPPRLSPAGPRGPREGAR
jgi:hypothetical protein